jgi:hypothetical protein
VQIETASFEALAVIDLGPADIEIAPTVYVEAGSVMLEDLVPLALL